MRRNPRNVRFDDLRRSATTTSESRDGEAAISSTECLGRAGPLVNIQPVRGMAKPYQVRQALKAIDRLEEMHA